MQSGCCWIEVSWRIFHQFGGLTTFLGKGWDGKVRTLREAGGLHPTLSLCERMGHPSGSWQDSYGHSSPSTSLRVRMTIPRKLRGRSAKGGRLLGANNTPPFRDAKGRGTWSG